MPAIVRLPDQLSLKLSEGTKEVVRQLAPGLDIGSESQQVVRFGSDVQLHREQ